MTKNTDLQLILDCIRGLHNYFFESSVDYAAAFAVHVLYPKQVENDSPGGLNLSLKPLKVKANDKKWMNRLGIDKRIFQEIFDKLRTPLSLLEIDLDPADALRIFLRLLATGEGYLPEYEDMILEIFVAIENKFRDYESVGVLRIAS